VTASEARSEPQASEVPRGEARSEPQASEVHRGEARSEPQASEVHRVRAVIFDLGGVVLGSPLHAIAEHEREAGIPAGFVNRLVADTGPTGAWSRLERGELELEPFYQAFDRECEQAGHALGARRLMERIALASQPRPIMLAAVRRIRARGLRVAALTNNWAGDGGTRELSPHFDVFVESSVLGLRKPDPRIYQHACARLAVEPREAVFLDDIGINLKAARALGMTTIKVGVPEQALAELTAVLGFSLHAEDPLGESPRGI
jgi:putative hydrolase of the HAD superfamily